IAFDEATHDRENERHRQIGGRFGEYARRVGDADGEIARRVDVDVVVADRVVRDDPQIRIRLEYATRQRITEQRDRRIGLGEKRDDVFIADLMLGRMIDDVELAGEYLASE